MPFRLLPAALLLGLGLTAGPLRAQAQTPAAPPLPAPVPAPDSSLRCTTYAFLSFVIHDVESGPEPIVAEGVGGTLTLHPDGRFEQRLSLGLPPKTTWFETSGSYQLLAGNRLRFSYTNQQGRPRTDTGSYRYQPQRGALVLTIEGFPAGSYSVYTLLAKDPAQP